PAPPVPVGAFSQASPGGLPSGWEPLQFGDTRPSSYRLVHEGGVTVVRAEADGSASGLVRRIDIDPTRFPVLRWRWKVEGVVPGGSYTRRDGDDYAARVYVIFDYPVSALSFGDRLKYRALQALGYRDLPTRALNYVWANQPSARATRPNAYTDWVQMVPVERGSRHAGTWRDARRNVAEDYRAAFGEEPPPIAGIAIMTDADNTGARAVAYYGDLSMTEE
ncbi:MAG: DUF3047 domain-containing protein, partial [Rubricoccaceae bacterium]|nr:DUF3047 domain-containing protein [Rubricoccaceae bacterium]